MNMSELDIKVKALELAVRSVPDGQSSYQLGIIEQRAHLFGHHLAENTRVITCESPCPYRLPRT